MDILEQYNVIDVNVYQENMFHTKMMIKDNDLNNYLFGLSTDNLTSEQQNEIHDKLRKEMSEIFYARNMP